MGNGILYPPPNGTILLCDYDGKWAEMKKRRPVVLISSVSSGLCLVVPLSTTEPTTIRPWHYLLRLEEPLPGNFTSLESWAKCDMISPVAYERLYLLRNGKNKDGSRRYVFPSVSEYDLEAIRTGVKKSIYG